MLERLHNRPPVRPRNAPPVAVVIPVYNGERFLRPCIESVLAQEYPPDEVVVVDDGSTDATPAVVTSFGDSVRYVRRKRGGVAAARNTGVDASSAEVIAFLDADDLWLPEKLGRQVDLLLARPEVAVVYSGYAVVDERLRPRAVFQGGAPAQQIGRWFTFDGWGVCFGSTGVVRRSAFERIGRFDETFSVSADLELCWRATQACAIAGVPEPLTLYRAHSRQMHRDIELLRRDMERLYGHRSAAGAWQHAEACRATANLHLRVALGRARARRAGPALSSLGTALRTRPDRLVAAPIEAAWRHVVHGTARSRTGTHPLTPARSSVSPEAARQGAREVLDG